MKHLIVIDDTGSPGNFNETRFLKEDRKTLVAVFIHAELRGPLEKMLSQILNELKEKSPITELHFKDLINKNNEFSDFKNEDIIKIIDNISDLFAQFKLPYFTKTTHKKTLLENGIRIQGKLIVDNLNLNKNEDNSLYSLILELKKFIIDNFSGQEIEIIMDEGRKKKNQTEEFEILKEITKNNIITYKSSSEYLLLQVADFFAYGINRMQTTVAKENRTDLDKTLLALFSKALAKQYSPGIIKLEVDIDNFTKDDYDYELYKNRQIHGNLQHWKDAQKE